LRRTYPHLLFRRHWEVSPKAQYELGQCHAIVQAICETPIRPEYHARLLRVSLIKGAQATTAIEGNTLSEEEIGRIVDGESLAPSKEYQEIEVRNILEAMNELLREVADDSRAELITPTLIRRFHQLIGKDLGDHLDAVPGQFRTDARRVGNYRCPDHEDVAELVGLLSDWLKEQFRYGKGAQTYAEAVIQAIVTHVYIEWIHPFGDGNGRTGRLLEFYVLLRAGVPDVASHILSNFYNQTRPEYYRQIERATQARDLSEFISYAVEGLRDGLLATLRTIQESQFETAWRGFVHDKFAERTYTKRTVFKRRRELMLAVPLGSAVTLEDLAILTPTLARTYAKYTERTLRRDVDILIEMDLLREAKDGYVANSRILRLQMARRLQHDGHDIL
jgi:Fic family protein